MKTSPPEFNDIAARQLIARCTETVPPSERPQLAGLKAAFAVYHRGVFQSDEQAWTFYGSTRQRFYEWKPAIQALLIEESSNTINTLLHNHTRDGTRQIVGDLHVIGNLIVSGTVSAQEIVERDMPTDWPPSLPASPPQSSLSSTPPPQEPGAQEPPSAESTKRSAVTGAATGAVVGAAAGGVGAVAAMPAAVASMGFGASGITAGSTAAAMMAAEATAAGGGVAAGGTVATLQSIGAAGLSGAATASVACVGAVAGAAILAGVGFGIGAAFLPSPKRHDCPALPTGTPCQPSEGALRGKWMVLTEEGFHNVVFYPFETEAEARRFFYDLRASRPKILFDSLGLEIKSGGWNPLALPTIRGQFGLSDTSIHDGFPPCMLRYSNVIALYSPSHGRFLRMMGDCVDGGGGRRGFDNLPDEWHSERFCVVIAKEGEIALYSVPNQRFIRMDHDADVNGKGGIMTAGELGARTLERLTIVNAGQGLIALHSKVQNRFIRMTKGGQVDGKGGRRNAGSLPRAWDSERFRIKQFPGTKGHSY